MLMHGGFPVSSTNPGNLMNTLPASGDVCPHLCCSSEELSVPSVPLDVNAKCLDFLAQGIAIDAEDFGSAHLVSPRFV